MQSQKNVIKYNYKFFDYFFTKNNRNKNCSMKIKYSEQSKKILSLLFRRIQQVTLVVGNDTNMWSQQDMIQLTTAMTTLICNYNQLYKM